LQSQLSIVWSHILCEYFQLPEISFLPFWKSYFLKCSWVTCMLLYNYDFGIGSCQSINLDHLFH
jgi:hypothetical protein